MSDNRTQRLFKAILPQSWAASMETESRQWFQRCPCGKEQSVWDMGGIRWKASGNPRRLLRCGQCGQLTWHETIKK